MIQDKGLQQPKLRNAAVLENLQSFFLIYYSFVYNFFFHELERGLYNIKNASERSVTQLH